MTKMLFAARSMVMVGLAYDPQILLLVHADGVVERAAATSPETCTAAVKALTSGRWVPLGGGIVQARCVPGDIFPAGHDCIAGYNCR